MPWLRLSLILLLITRSSYAQLQCIDDFLKSIDDDGKTVVTGSGMVFEVLYGDDINSMLWLPSSELIMCLSTTRHEGKGYEIWTLINISNSEKVEAFRLK
jgi:hypothetical protein